MNKDALYYPHMASQNLNWVLAGYIAATHKVSTLLALSVRCQATWATAIFMPLPCLTRMACSTPGRFSHRPTI